jgi:Ser-tRNA(Ala) deacylase AlaX
LFWTDPYCTELDTRVCAVDGNEVMVEETIFFAFSGGQERDHGTIGHRRVVNARKERTHIVYTLEDDHGLQVGDLARIQIDWPRRYRLMRLHFAAELVLELVTRALPSVRKVGAHIAPDKARIDFACDHNISCVFPDVTGQALDIVAADRDIITACSDEAGEVRYWQIDGFSRVPCGGTHVRTTGEIGPIELKRKNIGKGKERIEIYVENGAAQQRPPLKG